MAYTFQSFAVLEVATSTKLSQTEVNIRDHVHGVSGVGSIGSFTAMNTGQLAGFRNRIVNGDMRIDQRNSGGAVTPAASAFTLDRWNLGMTQASKLTVQQVADAPTGALYSAKISVASQFSPGATDQFVFSQRIMGLDVIDLNFGNASAATITATVWVKGSVAGTYSCWISNSALNRSYVGTIAVTTSWVQQSITFTADTTGTWLTSNGIGMYFGIDLGSGSNFNTTAGAWQAGQFSRTSGSVTFVNQVNASTLNISMVQVETGTLSSIFEQRSYEAERALCKYMYNVITQEHRVKAVAGSDTWTNSYTFPEMRILPTATQIAAGTLTNASAATIAPVSTNTAQDILTSTAAGDCFVTSRTWGLSADI